MINEYDVIYIMQTKHIGLYYFHLSLWVKTMFPPWLHAPQQTAQYSHLGPIEYWSDDVTKNFFGILAFWIPVPCICGMWSIMKNIHSPNLVRIGSYGPEI